LTTSSADPSPSQRSNRRSFTDEEKFAIVLESDQSDVRVAEVCRRHGIVSSMMFRRIQFGFAQKKAAKLATVVQPVEGIGVSFPPFVLNDLLQPPDSMMVVDLDDGDGSSRRSVAIPMLSVSMFRTGGGAMMIVPAG